MSKPRRQTHPIRNDRWVKMKQSGMSLTEIAERECSPRSSVHGVWTRYENRQIREKMRHEA